MDPNSSLFQQLKNHLFPKKDFNTATFFGHKAAGYTPKFVSSNHYLNENHGIMYPKDDLESLIFSLWYIAGVPMDRPSFSIYCEPLGKTLAECKKNGNVEEKILVSNTSKLN